MIPGPHRTKGGAAQLGARHGERGPFGAHRDGQEEDETAEENPALPVNGLVSGHSAQS
ncbi:hypothetical protein [Streptomyces sp. ISL-100]|uniref:hypothetical protein n=1 Tax=Streptomyces sp. ISL-100 TaxID=2819173 RepID=UPI001BEB411F|nr:hypothetical protein [Streptomyces sp. ISL-100]MBT2401961.1 hypothetical protein [Streptomyces sp. ISL-100]